MAVLVRAVYRSASDEISLGEKLGEGCAWPAVGSEQSYSCDCICRDI